MKNLVQKSNPENRRAVCMCFYFSSHATWLMESQFPNQGLKPDHGSESRILTTRPPGNSYSFESFTVVHGL